MRELPVFKGYTVDMKKREFRKFEQGKLPEFVYIDSLQGLRLYLEWAITEPEQYLEELMQYYTLGGYLTVEERLLAGLVKRELVERKKPAEGELKK
jgi:hypothetical protein